MSEVQIVRLYIGNISKQLADCLHLLESRLEKYGTLESAIEVRSKETFENINHFGYVNIKIGSKELQKLFTAFHKVKFMNSSLKIEKAKPSFNEKQILEKDSVEKDQRKKEAELQESTLKHDILQAHIQYGKEDKVRRLRDYATVEAGCIRKALRTKGLRRRLNCSDISYRVKFLIYNSTTKKWEKKVKIIKSNHKQKLWGYEKNKHRTDLVFKYQNGVWKDGNNHIVEIAKKKNFEADIEHVPVNEESIKQEIKKTTSVLDDFLNNFDFDKPINFNYEQDRKERLEAREKFDYEAESHFIVPDEDEEFENQSDNEEFQNHSYNESQEDRGILNNKKTNNVTESLKTLFNPNSTEITQLNTDNNEGFAFNLDESDMEEESNFEKEPIRTRPTRLSLAEEESTRLPLVEEEPSKDLKALFFPHFDSPFLVAQTQFNKLLSYSPKNNSIYESIVKWPEEFQEQRVDLMKSFKKRKRDVIRQNSKR